jgi:mRNA interferase MazF
LTTAAETGAVLLANLSPTSGHEQNGRRPVVVVSARRYSVIPRLFLAVPLTTTDRGLPHHIPVHPDRRNGLSRKSFAMTEQIRTLSSARIERHLGVLDEMTFHEISRYLHLFIA